MKNNVNETNNEKKICNKCNKPKILNSFHKNKNRKDGYEITCKICKKEYQIEYNSRPEVKISQKEYRIKTKNNITKYLEEYNAKPKSKELRKKNYLDNKEKYIKQSKKSYERNKEQRIKDNIKRAKEQYHTNPNYKIRMLLANRIYKVLKGITKKSHKTMNLLGCNWDECKQYLEKQFKPEMNWGNLGSVWEIDHIKPCASFNLVNLEEQFKCFNYTNLQPLFTTSEIAESFGYKGYIGNRDKGDKLI